MIGPDELGEAVRQALAAADLPAREPTFERPRNRDHGDWATNIALALAKAAGRPPREVAQAIVAHLGDVDGVDAVEIAGPGFINFRLTADAFADIVRTVVEAGDGWGRRDLAAGRTANVEFVSANPTGPLHVGHGRWVAAGDAIARLLEATGWGVTREYYLNDAGNQIRTFGLSVQAAMRGTEPPEDGYRGAYVADIAAQLTADGVPADDADAVTEAAYTAMAGQIRETLERFGITIDVWFSERTLHTSGALRAAVDRLLERGRAYESEGAIWLRTTEFGDDKDRVLIRANGEPTYFAADVAYLADKVRRGYDLAIYLLGADHHGYVGRLHALARAEGVPDGVVEVLIGQLVNLLRDGRPVRMGKRSGDFVTLDELVEEVGADAARYTFLRSSLDVPMDFDIAKVVTADRDNPVHYINYSYARIAGIRRTAEQQGVDPGAVADADLALLTHDREKELIAKIGAFPEVVADAAADRLPHRVARYAEDLAEVFHRFYEACRVVDPDEPALTAARFWLCEASRITFANALGLLGVTPRARM